MQLQPARLMIKEWTVLGPILYQAKVGPGGAANLEAWNSVPAQTKLLSSVEEQCQTTLVVLHIAIVKGEEDQRRTICDPSLQLLAPPPPQPHSSDCSLTLRCSTCKLSNRSGVRSGSCCCGFDLVQFVQRWHTTRVSSLVPWNVYIGRGVSHHAGFSPMALRLKGHRACSWVQVVAFSMCL